MSKVKASLYYLARHMLACCPFKEFTLPARPHRSVSRLQRQGRLAAVANYGYRLTLPSTAHNSPAGASKKRKMLIF